MTNGSPEWSKRKASAFCSVVCDTEHHLALHAALGYTDERRLCLLERKHRVDRRCELPCVGATPELSELRAVRLDDEVRGAFGLLGDRHNPARGFDHALERIPADGGDREVTPVTLFGEWPACELDSEMADAAGRTDDGNPLAVPQVAVLEDALPGTERCHRERCALDARDALRPRGKQGRRDDRVLGGHTVAIEWRQREDF